MDQSLSHLESLKEFIIDNFLFGDGEKLTPDTHLFEKGIIDSTGVLELVAFIEDNFKVAIKDEELIQDNFSSLKAMEIFLHSKINQVNSN
jgi:acyl carrier protein